MTEAVQVADSQVPDPQATDGRAPELLDPELLDPDWRATDGQAPDWRAQANGAARPDERRSRYVAVECQECGAFVLAAKFSVQHTSVQWDAAAVGRCAEFAGRTAAGEQTPLIERCGAMRASIENAALEGRLPVAPP